MNNNISDIKHIFVYGTLMQKHDKNVGQGRLHGSTYVDEATITGTLYDLGPFPAMRLEGEGIIHGEVFALPVDNYILPLLDNYEGYSELNPEASLYTRKTVEATLESGETVKCWVYQIENDGYKKAPVVENGAWVRSEDY